MKNFFDFKACLIIAFAAIISLSSLSAVEVMGQNVDGAVAKAKVVTVRAEGKCEYSRFLTLEQAEQKALQEAKQAALFKAGVPENVWSVFGTITESDGQQFQQAYSEMSVLAVGGLVNLLKEPEYSREFSKVDNREYVVCKIQAEVKKGEETDKAYQINVKGIAPVYKEGELIDMEITVSSQDSYVRVFWFNENEGSQIFPNQLESNHYILKNTPYLFPNHDLYDLVVEKKDKQHSTELVNVMVVATKRDYPFFEENVSFESLLKWIYNIPAHERCAYYDNFNIK